MQDRRRNVRDKVLLGGVAEIREMGATMDCVVRNLSERGACVEFNAQASLPEEISLTIKRKGRSYLAKMIWRHANMVGLAFRAMVTDAPVDDFDARLRRSEQKKRELQRRINELLGQD
jgi:PilZ domain